MAAWPECLWQRQMDNAGVIARHAAGLQLACRLRGRSSMVSGMAATHVPAEIWIA